MSEEPAEKKPMFGTNGTETESPASSSTDQAENKTPTANGVTSGDEAGSSTPNQQV